MKTFKFLLLFLCVLQWSCAGQALKIQGVSFVASPNKVEQQDLEPVVELNANYASVMPFGFIRSLEHPEVIYDTKRQWYGETKEGAKQYIEKLHQNKIAVMLKPQIWIWHGEFTGNLQMKSESEWKQLESSYRTFILEFAKLAEETNVAIFCIGTELEQFILHRQAYWTNLISEIKSIYQGELTYAANWDEYKRVPFWEALDYIGVDAYFPISHSKTPTLIESKDGWKTWKEELKMISEKTNKEVLFAEFGYRSVDFAAKEPWRSDRSMTGVNLKAQSIATQALFEEIWGEDWFAGGFIWKWFVNHLQAGGVENEQFTPQNKPAEEVIRLHYRQAH